ncbi:D-tyrosyl-tRNA(Tyr) deacylase [Kocuria soli]|uniref:D-aminoacyl-tRNA deacylase n=1 Tax=Kocuria soli TaxID=2485125 RepID=A0A3N3ZUC6_9MICC|nr:D-aminoacyl-tRNA deacylase [Kocuria soli]ROZ64710.1 D-tyrosyl-tRNA(Tyr) deacylase [Kocuria soli]
MRVILQRVSSASVTVLDPDGSRRRTGSITGPGLVALVGVTHGDDESTAVVLAEKTAGLRILTGTDPEGTEREQASCLDLDAPVLAVSQFTLYADCRRGKRPSWSHAAPGPVSEPVVEHYVRHLRSVGLTVQTGEFGADMQVDLVNDGPVTVILDSEELNRPRRG